jgi:predicted XRE-type DNA-binding protein
MTSTFAVECSVQFSGRGRGSRKRPPSNRESVAEAGRVPRVSRLMALAIRFDQLIRAGEVTGQAELATLGHVTRARISQIMSLQCLAPDIQEEVLFLPRTPKGRDPIQLRDLLPIARIVFWRQQRARWKDRVRPWTE